jgi:MFS family permease
LASTKHAISSNLSASSLPPSIYLPTFARSIGVENNALSALTVILFNVASAFGCVAMGSIVDKRHITTCILISIIRTTISVFVVWGFSNSLAPLYIFCLIYGFFAGSFTNAWPGIMRDITKKSDTADPSIVSACLAAG